MEGIVLITGAAGRIGTALREGWKGRFRMRFLDRVPIAGEEEAIVADLVDFDAIYRACEGVEAVVHLAANPSPYASWEDLLANNIIGTYHAFEAAKRAGVRRVIFASTVQVINGYPREQLVTMDMPPRPNNLYAASKVFGEALGRSYHEAHGLSVVCVRIGAFRRDWTLEDSEGLAPWLFSARDAVQFFAKALEAKDIGYAVLFGRSNTPVNWMDLEPARRLLGYEPEDSPTQLPLRD